MSKKDFHSVYLGMYKTRAICYNKMDQVKYPSFEISERGLTHADAGCRILKRASEQASKQASALPFSAVKGLF